MWKSALTVAGLALTAAPAFAQDAALPSFNLGVSNDYVYRGVSRTDRGPQLFGGADLALGDGYVGTWASNVRFPTATGRRSGAELDLYGGWRPEWRGYDLEFGLIGYGFVNEPGAHASYAEAKAGISRGLGPAVLGAAVYYSPEFFGRTGQALYAEANGSWRMSPALTASAALGRQSIERTRDYTTWNLGGTWGFAPHLGLDLRYWDTDAHRSGRGYGSKLVASLRATF